MVRTLLLGLGIAAILGSARAEDARPYSVVVLTADGKPAAGAKVWVYDYTSAEGTPNEPPALVADAAGKVSIPREKGARQLFVRDSAGRVSWAWLSAPWGDEAESEIRIILTDTAERAGRIVNAEGKPIAGATVTPLGFYSEDRSRRVPGGPAVSISLPEWEQARLAIKTDAEGRFKLAAPRAGYTISYRVKADGLGETTWSATGSTELETRLFAPGTLAVTATGVEAALLKGTRVRLSERAPREAAPGVHPVRFFSGAFNDSGRVTIAGVIPGRYEWTVERNAALPAVFEKSEPFEVASGKTTAVTAKFAPAAKVTGAITDKATGKGIAGVPVIVSITDGGGPYPREQLFVETGKDGQVTAHGPAGWYSAGLQQAPDGYALPAPASRREPAKSAKVEVGKAVTFTGRVVMADGKPVVGASVLTHTASHTGGRNEKIATDKDGRFAIKNLPPDDAIEPRVRLGNAVNFPQPFELEKATGPVAIEIGEANAAGFRGQVLDTKGKPVAGGRVSLRHHIQLVGRSAPYGTVRPLASATTDADGRYSFAGLWPRDQYHVHVTCDGFAEAEGKTLVGAAGEVQEYPVIRLTRAGLSISGTVVGSDGKPVGGAEVFGVDGPTRFATTSAADGAFTLTGFYDGGAFAFAKKPGFRLAAVPVVPGSKDSVVVALARQDEPPTALPGVAPEHRAAIDKFTRHALTLIWDSRATFGYGGNALRDMARFDLDTAKKWRDDEKKRTDGKTDLTYQIEREARAKTLFDTAKEDIDEALALIGALKPDDAFAEAHRLGERMLAMDKAKAARLAEEAAVKARQREIPAKVWSLAEAGDLAARAGNVPGGKKVLAEAAELAAKLAPDDRGRNTLAVGLVAARLAPYDWPKAEAILNSIKDASEFNRFLSASAARLAASDLPKAKQLLDQFKPGNSFYPSEARVRVALAVAKEKPDEAVKLIDGVKEGAYRFRGYLQLAALFAPDDKPRAIRTIDIAFDLLDRDAETFRSWSGYGGRAGFAAVGAVRAREIGYPDVAGLVARTLAMRPTAEDAWSADDRENNLVNIAAALALVDPATARRLLAGVAPPEEFLARATSQRRDWLFALALADPERAIKLADKLIERAKTARQGGNALSATGLVELCSILTAPDRLKELSSYGNLPREIGESD
jgi:uncharacterized GH25 family protein